MAGYSPIHIKGYQEGLIQGRENYLLPADAFPVLENVYIYRERIRRKDGYELLGRLQRDLTALAEPNPNGTATYSNDLLASFRANEPNAQIIPGTLMFYLDFGLGNQTLYQDNSLGNVTVTSGPFTISSGSINYSTGVLTLNFTAIPGAGIPAQANLSYYPCLPVMGLRTRELNNTNNEQLIAFDQIYAYRNTGTAWTEFIPGTTWTGTDSDFFWSTNYWVNASNNKLFWVTNFSSGDPIRYTDGTTWTNFAPTINKASGATLLKCLCILPFRSRLMVFNTFEGSGTSYPQRIRWAAIGNPIPNGAYQPWLDDVRGQGGFLDIPTSESIISVGFVRDNLVIYCERSTWQLRYTGRSIAPFQIEKVNSELGAEGTFSAVQFDTSLVGIVDKGVVECDSFKSQRIDIKIPDLIFEINNDNNGPKRVHGIRNFQTRLAFWTYPYKPTESSDSYFPNRRLVYNYENDSWAIFTDSLTCLGTYQPPTNRTWANTKKPWKDCNFSWGNRPSAFPAIVGGNQQGYVEFLDSQVVNDVSLYISNIIGNDPNVTTVISPNHNLETNQVIRIKDIPSGSPFDNLNDGIFGVVRVDVDTIQIWKYNSATDSFDLPQIDSPATYIGSGQIEVRDNFSIVSKKFNFIDEGQNIQMGYTDVLLDTTDSGAITLNVYLDYNEDNPINRLPENVNPTTQQSDEFFNFNVPTTSLGGLDVSKVWQRVFCPTRGAFITLEWTFSNAQMAGGEQEQNVNIGAQVIWVRRAGKQLPVFNF